MLICTEKDLVMTNVSLNNEVFAATLAAYVADINVACDERDAYEVSKNADCVLMQKQIKDYRKSMTNERVATVMLLCNVNAQFINRAERSNARYNIKSVKKVVDNALFLATSHNKMHHYCEAILKTAITLTDAKLSMTHEDAQTACTLKLKSSDKNKKALIKQYQSHVDISTANTQSSSSINALQMFHLLNETKDEKNNVAYTFNDEHYLAKQVRERLAAQ